jgi:hypothetical protein
LNRVLLLLEFNLGPSRNAAKLCSRNAALFPLARVTHYLQKPSFETMVELRRVKAKDILMSGSSSSGTENLGKDPGPKPAIRGTSPDQPNSIHVGRPELIQHSAATGRFCHRTSSPWRRGRTAHRHYGVAQPAMCRVGVHAGMPHRRYYDLRRTDGKVEASEALPD